MRSPDPRRRQATEKRRGQALAEFAMVAPFFFLILFGIIEAGRFIFYYEILHNATREGARYAIVNGARSYNCTGPPAPEASGPCDPTGAAVIARVRQTAFGVLGNAVTVTPCWVGTAPACDGDNARGRTVRVSAAYTYGSLVPLVPLPPITVQAESSLVINN